MSEPLFITNPKAWAPNLLQREVYRLRRYRDSTHANQRAVFTPERAKALAAVEAELLIRPVA